MSAADIVVVAGSVVVALAIAWLTANTATTKVLVIGRSIVARGTVLVGHTALLYPRDANLFGGLFV